MDKIRLTRYLAGRSTPEEASVVEERLATDGAWQEAARALSGVPRRSEPPTTWDTDAAWRRLAVRAGLEPEEPARRSSRLRGLGWRRTGIGLAAAAAVATVALFVLRRAPDAPGARPQVAFHTEPGQHTSVDLPDGSRVDLGAASTLRVFYPESPDRGPREVRLDGQAVFNVVHDEDRPLLVHAGNGIAEDMGTRFGVRAYSGDGSVQVVVTEGRVTLRTETAPAGSGTLLQRGDLGVLDAAGRILVTNGVDTAAYVGWTRGRLTFREQRLDAVARELSRWYGVDIAVPDSGTAARDITLDVPLRSLPQVLDLITGVLGIRQTHDGEGWVLGPSSRR